MNEQTDAAAVQNWLRLLGRHDPEVGAAVERIPAVVYGRTRSIDPQTKELIMVVMMTALRGPAASIRHHVRRAVEAGATRMQILEAIELVITPAGMAVFEHGLTAWADALGEAGLDVDGAVYTRLPSD